MLHTRHKNNRQEASFLFAPAALIAGTDACAPGSAPPCRPTEKTRRLAGFLIFGGDEGDRTPDLGIANAALSQLSYIPKIETSKRRAMIEIRRCGVK